MQNTVYIVIYHYYDETAIKYVYASEHDAKIYAAILNDNEGSPRYDVIEMPVRNSLPGVS